MTGVFDGGADPYDIIQTLAEVEQEYVASRDGRVFDEDRAALRAAIIELRLAYAGAEDIELRVDRETSTGRSFEGARLEGSATYGGYDVVIGRTGNYNYGGQLMGEVDAGGERVEFSFTGDALECTEFLLSYVDRMEEVLETRQQLRGSTGGR